MTFIDFIQNILNIFLNVVKFPYLLPISFLVVAIILVRIIYQIIYTFTGAHNVK